MRARGNTWSFGASSQASGDVWFVTKGGSIPSWSVSKGGSVPSFDRVAIVEGTLSKRGGSHGGYANWKSRYMKLIGSTLFYAESAKSTEAKGHIKLVGLRVRADAEAQKPNVICIYWPAEPSNGFFMQASNSQELECWLEHLRQATMPTASALGELSVVELTQRYHHVVGAAAATTAPAPVGRSSLEAALAAAIAKMADQAAIYEAERAAASSESGRARHASASSLVDRLQVKMRQLVSLEKRRFQQDGFDLDLSYITPRLIAMGFPSAGIEGSYRNPIEDVRRFFATRHPDACLVINLCEERVYEPAALLGECGADDAAAAARAAHYPFDDHNPPCLELIGALCDEARRWLLADPSHVIAVHCKAGKGRTGLVLTCLLVYLGVCVDADDAIAWFAKQRTHDAKGVTIPSQLRYIRTFCALLHEQQRQLPDWFEHGGAIHASRQRGTPPMVDAIIPRAPPRVSAPVLRLKSLIIRGCPTFDLGGGCDPYVEIKLVRLTWRPSTASEGASAAAWRRVEETRSRVIGCTRALQTHHLAYDSRAAGIPAHYAFGADAELPLGDDDSPTLIQGDVKLCFKDRDAIGKDDKMFEVWLHTSDLERAPRHVLRRPEIDRACKKGAKKKYPRAFALEIEAVPTGLAELPAGALPAAAEEGEEGASRAWAAGGGGGGGGGGGQPAAAGATTMWDDDDYEDEWDEEEEASMREELGDEIGELLPLSAKSETKPARVLKRLSETPGPLTALVASERSAGGGGDDGASSEAAAAAARAAREKVLASKPQVDAAVRAPGPRERGRSMALEAQSMAAQRASVMSQVGSLEPSGRAGGAREGGRDAASAFADDDEDEDDWANEKTVEVL